MFAAQYASSTSWIIDLSIAVLFLIAITVFFLAKKSVKLLIIYSAAFLIYVGVVVCDAYFNIPVARAIANIFLVFLTVSVVMVYQSDLKVLFFSLTKTKEKVEEYDTTSDEELKKTVNEIVLACQSMSKSRTGALIVIAPTSVAGYVLETGIELGAVVSSALLEAIFNTRAPFHDGAAVIKGNKVLAAGCFLPLSQSQSVSKTLGTRHRAGIGITEETDMCTIIVSEETGIISIARKGELRRFITPDRLRDILQEIFKVQSPTKYRSIG